MKFSKQVFSSRFIPPTVPCKFGPKGLEIVEISEYKEDLKLEKPKFRFATLQERLLHNLTSSEARKSKNGTKRPPPFDAYCPSMMEKIDNCVCAQCGTCWPSAAAKDRHRKAHKGRVNSRFEFQVGNSGMNIFFFLSPKSRRNKLRTLAIFGQNLLWRLKLFFETFFPKILP